MKGKKFLVILSLVLIGIFTSCLAPMAQAQEQAVERFVLSNGLTVLVQENRRQPLVYVTCVYKVGAVNEVPGITGIAHYIEHMCYRATESISEADIDGIVDRIGGRWNGGTGMDSTMYAENVPSWALESVLHIEAERMGRVLFDPIEFERERNSIIAEALSYDRPASQLWDLVMYTSFELHPARNNILGWISDLLTVSRDDAYKFYKDYYGPNNAVLAIVGDVDAKEARRLVEKHFGPLHPSRCSTEVKFVEPLQRGEKRVELIHPGIQKHLAIVYRAPEVTHPDFPVLVVLDRILNSRDRLQKAVTNAGGDKVFTSHRMKPYQYVYGIRISANESTDLERIVEPIQGEIDRLGTEGVTTEELEQSREQRQKSQRPRLPQSKSRSLSSIARQLINNEMFPSRNLRDDIRKAEKKVTSADIQAYVRRWLQPTQRTVGFHIPGELRLKDPLKVPPRSVAPKPRFRPSPVPARALQPVPGPKLETARLELENGVAVRVAQREGKTAMLSVRLGLGSALDPPGKEGLTLLVVRLLSSDSELTSLTEKLGVEFRNSASSSTSYSNLDYIDLSARFLVSDMEAVIGRIVLALQASSFEAEQIEKERTKLVGTIKELMTDVNWVARRRVLEGVAPAWHPPIGTWESLNNITPKDVNGYLSRHLTGGSIFVSLVAPGDPEELLDIVSSAFDGIPKSSQPDVIQRLEQKLRPGEDRIPMAGKTQAVVVAGLPGVARSHPDYLALKLLNYIVGDINYSGRLGWHLVKGGLVYSVKATPYFGRTEGPVIIRTATAPSNLEKTLSVIREVITKIGKKGVEEWELREAKAANLGRMLRNRIHAESLGQAIASVLLDSEYFSEELLDYAGRSAAILAVTLEQLNEVARRYYRPELLGVAVVGALPGESQ